MVVRQPSDVVQRCESLHVGVKCAEPETFILVGDAVGIMPGRLRVHSFAKVFRMSDNSVDPAGNTEAFRAFSQDAPQEPAAPSKTPLIIGGVAVAVILLALIVWLVA